LVITFAFFDKNFSADVAKYGFAVVVTTVEAPIEATKSVVGTIDIG
jgi:hypothetical protein